MLVVALVGAGVGLAIGGTDGARDLLTEVGESNWGFIAFVATYALTVVLLLPGTLGTVTAGAVFGFPVGAAAALAGATIGSTCAFIISRAMGPTVPNPCSVADCRTSTTSSAVTTSHRFWFCG